jgi:endonuclease G
MKYLMLVLMLFSSISYSQAASFDSRDCDQIINHGPITICYDYNMKGAKYVSYTLYGDTVNKLNLSKRPSFRADMAIPEQYRVSPKDYYKNSAHMDRGHLAPDAPFDYSSKVLKSIYVMSNIIPQYDNINRHTWVKAEITARELAVSYGSIEVLNGVVYPSIPKYMGDTGIVYPEGYWKMLYPRRGTPICYYYDNKPITTPIDDRLEDHLVNCKNINIGHTRL